MVCVDETDEIRTSSMLSASVLNIRRIIFPESVELDDIISRVARNGRPEDILLSLISSKEFRKKFPGLFTGIPFGYNAQEVEYDVSPELLDRLFERVSKEWEKLGRVDPVWSVLSIDTYKNISSGNVPAEFFRSGEREIDGVVRALHRHGIAPRFNKAVEFGCGLGRLSIPLSRYSDVLFAYDISSNHLEAARRHAAEVGATNIKFEQIQRARQPIEIGYDFYYSSLVYQHNPPPVIARLVEQALSGLASNGIAIFQVPVFRKGYRFRVLEYLSREMDGIEMHVLPQRTVFDLIDSCGCRLLDVFDSSVNLRDRILSNIFTVQKRAV